MHIVVCEDGAIRHASPFETKAEARQFAEWGHCCTNDYAIFGVDFSSKENYLEFAAAKAAPVEEEVVADAGGARWIPAAEMRVGDVILLSFNRTATVQTVGPVSPRTRFVQFSTEHGKSRMEVATEVHVERRN